MLSENLHLVVCAQKTNARVQVAFNYGEYYGYGRSTDEPVPYGSIVQQTLEDYFFKRTVAYLS